MDDSTIVKRNTVVFAFDNGIGDLGGTELGEIDAQAGDVNKRVREADDVFLESIVLHEENVWQGAEVIGGRCCGHFGLDVVPRGLNDVELEVGIGFLVDLFSFLHGIDVESRVPAPDGQSLVIGSCRSGFTLGGCGGLSRCGLAATRCQGKDHGGDQQDNEQFLHVFSSS